MTDEQPTDHRAEAESWLDHGKQMWEAEGDSHTIACALIGIGHALLAGQTQQPTIVLRAPEHLDAETIEQARADFLKHYRRQEPA